ncbi:hypothetical protein QQX10_13485 [Demequina sp. SYSU T00039]|uniref:DUF8094 domain-containing protein n=1 Tax=Demequina lignilytica TaxID=3051663 RepID=A0AAW7M7S4_9MICO|nr:MULTISPECIES: hypothetical protein [unclassified Demequina]MDN4479106.1 hypothetical protein [Demequina sp. SYSU T00039-1]MDN4489181.1 hypothetical protein [Demequina sp. SYSU T00039]MDN4490284.1 hypothetical protein [Demequina sp. SYSU T00068]
MRRRSVILAALAVAPALALAACTPSVPQPVAAVPAQETSAVTQVQIDRIVPETFAELAAADEAADASLLGERITGDAVTVRTMEYAIAEVDGAGDPDVIPEDMQAVYVTDAETWPRVMVGVTEAPDESTTPVVVLWVQEDVESDYRMVGWAHMIPGATLPAMPGVSVGAPMVDLQDAELQPQEVLHGYLDYLRKGNGSDYKDAFEDDSYRDQIFANRKQLRETAEKASGTYKETYEPNLESTYAIGTSDGGALLFAPVTVEGLFTVEDGATVTLSSLDKSLISGSVEDTVRHTYTDLLVISIPADADALPVAVAADHQLTAVSAK